MNYKKYSIADIHLHLDGSLSSKAIIEVAKEEGICLPTYDEKELQKYLEVDDSCKSLDDYLTKFDLPNLALQTKFGLKHCTLDLLERLANDGMKYCEIRMAPQLSTRKGLSQDDVVKTLSEAMIEGEQKYGIKSNLIVCMMRGKENQKENRETIEIAKKYKNEKIVGIDIAGPEIMFPNEMFDFEFALIKKYGLNLTIHSGEAGGPNSVKTAIQFGANRIGHGIHAIEDKNLCNLIKRLGICLEICPKSNIDTKAVNSYEELPIKQFLDLGIKISINSDDMTVSNTSLKKEYENLYKMGFSEKDLQKFALNTIEACYADNDTKEYLKSFIL